MQYVHRWDALYAGDEVCTTQSRWTKSSVQGLLWISCGRHFTTDYRFALLGSSITQLMPHPCLPSSSHYLSQHDRNDSLCRLIVKTKVVFHSSLHKFYLCVSCHQCKWHLKVNTLKQQTVCRWCLVWVTLYGIASQIYMDWQTSYCFIIIATLFSVLMFPYRAGQFLSLFHI